MDFKRKKWGNATHQSTTDPQAKLYKQGWFTETKLRYVTQVLSENRYARVMKAHTTQTDGRAVDGRAARGRSYAQAWGGVA